MPDLSRRDLMTGAVSLAAACALAGFTLPRQQKKVGWASLGLGNYARGQIMPRMSLCRNTELKAVISGTPDKARQVAAEYGLPESKIYNYQSWEAIANDEDIEVVYVITPPGTHAEFTIKSLQAGKHVCCEKPMSSTVAEARQMVEAARKAGRRLQIGYRCHFEAHNLAAMKALREGAIGPVRTVRSEHGYVLGRGSWHLDPALGGLGAIGEIGVYAIQALCYLAGEDPIAVSGSRHKLDPERFKHVEDANQFILRFPSGCQGIGGTAYTWNANNMRAMGPGGRLDAEPATGCSGHRFTLNGRPLEIEEMPLQWVGQMDHLSDCVRDPAKTLIAPGEMGLRDMIISEAILKSATEGREIQLTDMA
ncbi:MAG: Gfo/Idh/MocA family oxidoreductase [Fimbriimonadaceae bacterium]|nr:Gfo/Idh/MocA family oxidoreductase [Fimbriimonadaceae bacterium]